MVRKMFTIRINRSPVLMALLLMIVILGMACSGQQGAPGSAGQPASVIKLQALEAKIVQLEQQLETRETAGSGGQPGEAGSLDAPVVAYSGNFPRIPADTVMGTGQSVAVECQDPKAEYPYTPYDWPDASATLEFVQAVSSSTVTVEVSSAKPNTYYTLWLRLRGKDANGNVFGGSPLTGKPGTALIPTSALPAALAAMGEAVVRDLNGFHTDQDGNGSVKIDLDFPIVNGAYPFHRFEGFDPTDERFPLDAPSAHPVAIVGQGVPFTLRLASHCVDGLSHGLLPGPHEGWFDWKVGE